MNVKKTRTNLLRVIIDDLFQHYRLSLLLLVLIIISAFFVLITTQATRLFISEQERLLLERDVLENEWRNLILEENVLADHKRIERQAINKLNMQNVNSKTETIVIVKNKSLAK
jgi:cell division protein FtsL